MDRKPSPKEGKTDVKPLLQEEFNQQADLRYQLGLERYGRPLQTFNGRDAGLDAFEEWYDLGIYLKQLRLEHTAIQAELILMKRFLNEHNLMSEFLTWHTNILRSMKQ